jgi:predicted nucleic acid-binding protein
VKLIDTSCWVHQIRVRGDRGIRLRVESALTAGTAAWCAQVRLELWAGARSDQDRKLLRDYERVLPDLPITDQVWALACDLGDRARRAGISAAAGDLLIAACARFHGAELDHADADFDLLNAL